MTIERTPTEHVFQASDGARLFYRAWPPAAPGRKAAILFHRGHEHSGRWQAIVDTLAMDDTWFFAWDARGHGRSDGERGYARNFGRMVKDADEFVRHVLAENGLKIEETAVLAQSVGAVLAASWVHDYARGIL